MLVASLSARARGVPKYEKFKPRPTLRWVFVNGDLAKPSPFESWPSLSNLFPVHYSGLNENRYSAFITIEREDLEKRMRRYFDPRMNMEDLARHVPGIDAKMAGYDPKETRKAVLAKQNFDPSRIVRLSYRPFDDWWTYWEGRFKLFNRPRPDFFAQLWPGNFFLSASQTARKGGFNSPIVVNKFGDLHLQDPWSQFFPLFLRITGEFGGDRVDPNLHPQTLEKLCQARKVEALDQDHHWSKTAMHVAETVFWHALAVFWSPAYCRENAAALRQDWPRVPIPADPSVLDASAKLGQSVSELLIPDKPVLGVTTGNLRHEYRSLGVPSKIGNDPFDYKIDAGWGFRGQKNAVMCGKGKVVLSKTDPDGALDVYLNDRVYWANVPADVWTLTIGGYPVLKKWLSYREFKVLGRPLREEEMTYFTEVVRRLKALLLLSDDLDANYRATSARTLEV